MSTVIQSPYSRELISAWLRGLLALALADGDFDPEEQKFITELTHHELLSDTDVNGLEPITVEELASAFAEDDHAAENFLRTAVMVAVADGIYSPTEDELLEKYCDALQQRPKALDILRKTLQDKPPSPEKGVVARIQHRDVLKPVKHWMDGLEIHDPQLARFLCRMIPSQCPFEREVKLFGHKVVHIPPLCKLNPLYEQLVGLRFRALSYLADDCGEDVSPYF